MERSKAGTKKGQTTYRKLPKNNNDYKHNWLVFYKIWKKLNETQLTKKYGLEQS